MKLKKLGLWMGAAILGFASLASQAADISLYDYNFNIDGVTGTGLSEVDLSAFNTTTGLGSISVTISSIGSHTFDAFFDHEIDEFDNTYFNEFGDAVGVAAAGQSWEIDEPGWVFGDIYDNFLASTLDNFNNVPSGLDDDVSMAMGWDFVLGVGETALIDLVLGTSAPTDGFYLSHTDPDSAASVYLSSNLTIRGVNVSEPSIALLLGLGLLGVAARRRVNMG